MKSPFTDKEMILRFEKRELSFRKEKFEIYCHFYECLDTQEKFEDNQLAELNIYQVYNQYRAKYHIPTHQEIKNIREQYAISGSKMSEVLGFGENMYSKYENGEIPTLSNAKLIRQAQNPIYFLDLLKESSLKDKEKDKIKKQVEKVRNDLENTKSIRDVLFGKDVFANSYNGFVIPNLDKIGQIIHFFAEKLQPYKTAMNKLLFYADFLHYKRTGFSMSGLSYNADTYGTVPHKYETLFDYAEEQKNVIIRVETNFKNEGADFPKKFLPLDHFTYSLLASSEVETLEKLLFIIENHQKRIPKTTLRDLLVTINHEEKAWIDNKDNKDKLIDYQQYAFELKL